IRTLILGVFTMQRRNNMAFTNELSNNVLNHVFSGESYTPPEQLYVALYTPDGEVSGGGYSRQEISFGKASGGVIRNDAEVHFPIAESNWGMITEAILFDAVQGGNQLDVSTIDSTEVVENEK